MSIPTSVVIVGLVALWLAILVPMFAKRREPVPETDMDTGTFRVLRRASSSVRRRPRFGRRDEFDDDYAGQDDMLHENHELDQNASSDGELADGEFVDGYENADANTDYIEYAEYVETEYAEVEYSEVEYAEVAEREPVKAPRRGLRAWGRRAPEAVEYAETADYTDAVEFADTAEHERYTGVAQYSGAQEYTSGPEYQEAAEQTYATASYTSYDEDHRQDAPRRSGRRDPLEDFDESQLRPVPRRPGRGGYDPDAAEAARAYRYSRRRRVAVILLVAGLAFSVAAYLFSPMLWTGTVVSALLLVAFLTYLRRQVRIENDITARRLARLRRARQIRPEYHLEREEAPVTGSSFGRGAVAVSQVPPSGYRRGREIVDLEDDDPSFDDLDYYQPALYRRASGQ